MINCLTGNHGRNKGNLYGDLKKKNPIVTLQNTGLYSNLPHKILPKKKSKTKYGINKSCSGETR